LGFLLGCLVHALAPILLLFFEQKGIMFTFSWYRLSPFSFLGFLLSSRFAISLAVALVW